MKKLLFLFIAVGLFFTACNNPLVQLDSTNVSRSAQVLTQLEGSWIAEYLVANTTQTVSIQLDLNNDKSFKLEVTSNSPTIIQTGTWKADLEEITFILNGVANEIIETEHDYNVVTKDSLLMELNILDLSGYISFVRKPKEPTKEDIIGRWKFVHRQAYPPASNQELIFTYLFEYTSHGIINAMFMTNMPSMGGGIHKSNYVINDTHLTVDGSDEYGNPKKVTIGYAWDGIDVFLMDNPKQSPGGITLPKVYRFERQKGDMIPSASDLVGTWEFSTLDQGSANPDTHTYLYVFNENKSFTLKKTILQNGTVVSTQNFAGTFVATENKINTTINGVTTIIDYLWLDKSTFFMKNAHFNTPGYPIIPEYFNFVRK